MPRLFLAAFFVLTLVVTMVSCSTTPAKKPPQAAASEIQIELNRMGYNQWLAQYRLTKPIRALAFVTAPQLKRRENWSTDSAFEWSLIDRHEVLMRKDRLAFDRVSVSFAGSEQWMRKEYTFTQTIEDENLVFYSGHLQTLPITHQSAHTITLADIDAVLAHEVGIALTAHARHDEHVFDDHGEAKSTIAVDISHKPDADNSPYLYFGVRHPVDVNGMKIMVQRDIPAWLNTAFMEQFETIGRYYQKNLTGSLSQPVMVYLNKKGNAEGMTSFNGGVAGNAIQLTVEGNGWQLYSTENFNQLMHLFAHELAHVWNAKLIYNAEQPEAAWLHEGGADLLKDRALLDLNIIDRAQFEQSILRAFNECKMNWGDISLLDNHKFGQYQLSYSCGEVIQYFAARAAYPTDTAPEITLWRGFITKQLASGKYTSQDLYDLLDKEDPRISKVIVDLVASTDAKSRMTLWQQLAGLAGLGFTTLDNDPLNYQSKQTQSLLRDIMAADCQSQYSLYSGNVGFHLDPLASCENLKGTDKIHIDRIEDISWDQGKAIFAAVTQQCASKKTIRVGNALRQFTLKCPEPLPIYHSMLSLVPLK